MTAHVAPPPLGLPGDQEDAEHLFQQAGRRPAVDLLAEGIERVRDELVKTERLAQRVRIFCLGLEACRDLGASDVVHDEFVLLAADSGLLDDLMEQPPYSAVAAAETINHLIRFTFLDRPTASRSE